MTDVVRCAGGWLFDQVMAGWDVTVLTAAAADSRPLRILGASAGDIESAPTALARGAEPRAIAVDARLYDADERVRRIVLDAIDSGSAEVRLWDSRRPSSSDGGVVEYRLTVAARAFKAQALAAVAVPADSIANTELFTTGTPGLMPAA